MVKELKMDSLKFEIKKFKKNTLFYSLLFFSTMILISTLMILRFWIGNIPQDIFVILITLFAFIFILRVFGMLFTLMKNFFLKIGH